MNSWGRKPIIVSSLILAGLACTGAAFAEADWLVTTFSLAGEHCKNYVFIQELYPLLIFKYVMLCFFKS